MDATIDNDGTASDPDANNASGDIAVDADALAVGGVAPDAGDTVQFAVEGTVSSTTSGTVMVTPTKINGQPVTPPTPAVDAGVALRSQAMAADNGTDY